MHITNEMARQQGLPGCDTFKYTHLIYMEGINRMAGAASLNYEAFKSFADTFILHRSRDIIDEVEYVKKFLEDGKNIARDKFIFPKNQAEFGHRQNLEYLKIGAGFELALKSKLLALGYVVHVIDRRNSVYKNLADQQKDRPIKISELLNISGYMYDGNENYLPGISKNSISFSQLLDLPNYKCVFSLSNKELDVIGYFREMRNNIHFPGDVAGLSMGGQLSWGERICFLKRFIFDHIVKVNREICSLHQLHMSLAIPEYDSLVALKLDERCM